MYAFFCDPFRSPRLADRLEEDLFHHASVFSRCNARNVTFRIPARHSADTLSTINYSYIAGKFSYWKLLLIFLSFVFFTFLTTRVGCILLDTF